MSNRFRLFQSFQDSLYDLSKNAKSDSLYARKRKWFQADLLREKMKDEIEAIPNPEGVTGL